MNIAEKFGCAATLILVAVIVFGIGLIVLEVTYQDSTRHQCLECGYPNYTTHGRNGYCVRVGSVVVPVEEACPQRAEQGKGKSQ